METGDMVNEPTIFRPIKGVKVSAVRAHGIESVGIFEFGIGFGFVWYWADDIAPSPIPTSSDGIAR